MIHIYIRGRLGNQLFQYGFIRSLQKKNASLKVCYHFNEVYSQGDDSDGWENSLRYFNVVDVEEGHCNARLNILQRIFLKLYWLRYPHNESIDIKNRYQMKWVWLLSKLNLFYLDLGYFDFPMPKEKWDTIVSGNFESEKYFEDIRACLIKEITPKYLPLPHNLKLLDTINSTNSVCVSIRRGDFICNSSISKVHNICNQKYFEAAIRRIGILVENPVFIFFSDDIDWAKENIKIPFESYFERGDDPVWEKLRLMYSCKHFIISNSTFSWWAQYLGKYPGKKVIAPSRWYNNPFQSELYMDGWEIIEVD